MPDRDPAHWLYRLEPPEWLAAAENELAAARRAAEDKQQRAAVAQARRAAGMALNALLWAAPDEAYGRSYMDHLQALARDPAVREDLRQAARRLLEMPLAQEIVTIGRGSTTLAEPAALIVEYVRETLAPPTQA
jgi:HEPN domain-containing protein